MTTQLNMLRCETDRWLSCIPESDRKEISRIVISYPLSVESAVRIYDAVRGNMHLVEEGARMVAEGNSISYIACVLSLEAEDIEEKASKGPAVRVIRV